MASVAADDRIRKNTAAAICCGYFDAYRQISLRLPILRVSSSCFSDFCAIGSRTSSVAVRPQLPRCSFRDAAYSLLREPSAATLVTSSANFSPRGLMLYDAYEVQRSFLAGASKLAGMGAGWLNNPANPLSYSSTGPVVA